MLYPGRPEATAELLEWLGYNDRMLHLSTVSIFELSQGVGKLKRAGATSRAAALGDWIDVLVDDFETRLLDVNLGVARWAGHLSDAATAIGRHPGVADILIAATARSHSLTLLTHNLRHFQPLDIGALDPLDSLPS
jgi:predicted nucleic acid-binding protein